jgi:hypothetical protein
MMPYLYILDAAGEPIEVNDVLVWAKWYESADRAIAETHVDEARVSTVFLSIDLAAGLRQEPLLWETAIFRHARGYADGSVTIWSRYGSRAGAIAGHDACCAFLRGELPEAIARELAAGSRKNGTS